MDSALASRGEHDFLSRETVVEDIRRRPIQCFGYSVGCYRDRMRRWHPSVRIERALFHQMKTELKAAALKEEVESLRGRFRHLVFEPYAPVRRQVLALLGAVNTARRSAGLETVPLEALRLRRSTVAPFGRAGYGCINNSFPGCGRNTRP